MAKEEDACVAGVAYFNGRRILQWSKRCYAHSSLQAEAFALIIAAQVAQTMNWSSILFPSDAKLLVSAIHRASPPSWDCFCYSHEFFDTVSCFCQRTCKWVARKDNVVTHNLCHLGQTYYELGLHIL